MACSKIIGSDEVRAPLCPLSTAGGKVLFSAIDTYEGSRGARPVSSSTARRGGWAMR